jgi:hypothetical protein
MEDRIPEIRQQIKSLVLLYTATLAAMIMFLAVVFFMHYTKNLDLKTEGLDTVFMVLVPLISVAAMLGSRKIFNLRMSQARQKTGLFDKLIIYKQASITRNALIEFPAFLAIVAFLLTANYLFTGFAALMTLVFVTVRPGLYRIGTELELNSDERALLERAMNA